MLLIRNNENNVNEDKAKLCTHTDITFAIISCDSLLSFRQVIYLSTEHKSSSPSSHVSLMCRLSAVVYFHCRHLHHFQPLDACEDGFQFGNPGRCLAEPVGPPQIKVTFHMETRPYCTNCLERQIRDRYDSRPGTKKQKKIDQAKMVAEIDNMRSNAAQLENDWTVNEQTTWIDGIRIVVWDPRAGQAIIIKRSGEVSDWKPNELECKGEAIQVFLKERD